MIRTMAITAKTRLPISRHFGGMLGRRAKVVRALRFERVFGDQAVFIEAQKARDRANESAIEHAAGQLVPLIILDGFEETRADARGGGNFLQGDAAHFAFAFQMFAERCRRHSQKPRKI